jgi:hypothetical protein
MVADTLGSQWLAIISRPTLEGFSAACTPDVALSLSAAGDPSWARPRCGTCSTSPGPCMPASTGSPIKTRVKRSTTCRCRTAKASCDVSAILLSPWPESLCTFEQMWSRLAGPDQHHTPGA